MRAALVAATMQVCASAERSRTARICESTQSASPSSMRIAAQLQSARSASSASPFDRARSALSSNASSAADRSPARRASTPASRSARKRAVTSDDERGPAETGEGDSTRRGPSDSRFESQASAVTPIASWPDMSRARNGPMDRRNVVRKPLSVKPDCTGEARWDWPSDAFALAASAPLSLTGDVPRAIIACARGGARTGCVPSGTSGPRPFDPASPSSPPNSEDPPHASIPVPASIRPRPAMSLEAADSRLAASAARRSRP